MERLTSGIWNCPGFAAMVALDECCGLAFGCLFNAVDGDKQDLEAKGNFCPARGKFLAPVLGSNFWGWHWEPVTSDRAFLGTCLAQQVFRLM